MLHIGTSNQFIVVRPGDMEWVSGRTWIETACAACGHVIEQWHEELDPPEECCGFGGTFSVKFPDISGAMVRSKVEAIQRTGASTVIATDPSCLMQIQGALDRAGAKVRTMHQAEVLASK